MCYGEKQALTYLCLESEQKDYITPIAKLWGMMLQTAKDGKFMEALNSGMYLLKYMYTTVQYFREHAVGSKQGRSGEAAGRSWS